MIDWLFIHTWECLLGIIVSVQDVMHMYMYMYKCKHNNLSMRKILCVHSRHELYEKFAYKIEYSK